MRLVMTLLVREEELLAANLDYHVRRGRGVRVPSGRGPPGHSFVHLRRIEVTWTVISGLTRRKRRLQSDA
jgi:hypothetical protein